ncbi:hypothetical protein GV054_09605 [Marinomonas mediterranea]|nr:hypothetical protein [Marinomonas mediterranea]WCN13242.1 hypothetical protein GV054_09605 [Marinomonas mediterranea]
MSALHQKTIDTMTLKGLSPLTQMAYLYRLVIRPSRLRSGIYNGLP